MITSSTFIPSQRAKDLLCALWVEYGCQGHKQRLIETRQFLLDLRAELGAADYALFEKDLVRLMERNCARIAMQKIIRAAILRGEEQGRKKYLRTIYQPA
jgi:hypothetical protein